MSSINNVLKCTKLNDENNLIINIIDTEFCRIKLYPLVMVHTLQLPV